MSMKKYDYVLVGAGLFSGVFAYQAVQKGRTCLVVEKRDHLGGNIYCENIEGIHVKRHIIDLAFIIGDRAIGVAVARSQAVHEFPDTLI